MRKTMPAAPAGVASRLSAFVLERHPLVLPVVQRILDRVATTSPSRDPRTIEAFSTDFLQQLDTALSGLDANGIPDPTPRVSACTRLQQAITEVRDACEGFLAREAIAASLTAAERIEILRGMVL